MGVSWLYPYLELGWRRGREEGTEEDLSSLLSPDTVILSLQHKVLSEISLQLLTTNIEPQLNLTEKYEEISSAAVLINLQAQTTFSDGGKLQPRRTEWEISHLSSICLSLSLCERGMKKNLYLIWP